LTEWMTLADAAKATGLSRSAIRCRRQRGSVECKHHPEKPTVHLYGVRGGRLVSGDEPEAAAFVPAYEPSGEVPRVAAICSDVHIPEHDLRAWEGFLAWVSDWQPDVVVLAGDIAELESCSQHGGSASPEMFTADMAALKAEVQRVRDICPRAEMVYLEGNHETRLHRITVNRIPTLSGALDIPTQVGLADLKIAWLPEGQPYHLGKLRIVHGWYANKYHAAKHVEVMGGSVLYGHTHKPQVYMTSTAEGVRGGFGNGCLRTLDPSWMNGRPAGWMHGFSVVHVWPDGTFQVTPIWMTPERRFAYGGKNYG
jgi:predicted phosphodiesterase